MALYTPFFEKATSTVGRGYGAKVVGDLAKSAYLGDQQALGELFRLDPNLGQQIKNQKLQEEQMNLSTAAQNQALRQNDQQWAMQNRQLIEQTMQKAASMPDFQSAQQLIASEIEALKQSGVQVPEQFSAQTFTPEVYQQIKQVYASKQAPIKVGAGESLVDPATMEPVYTNPAADKAPDQRSQKIASLAPQLAQTLGVPLEQAQVAAANVVDGIVRYDVTEQGRVLEINTSNGQVKELPISGSQAKQLTEAAQLTEPQGNDGFSLYGLSDEISGVGPSTKALAAKVTSMFGGSAFPETVTNRQIADGAMQGLVRALSINDQYPVREIERIRSDMAQISPSLTSGGSEIRAKMKGLNTLLSSNLETARRDASNPEMPTELRAGAARAANDIKNFLDILGYVDSDVLKTPQDVTRVPISSLEEFVRSSSDAQLSKLPDDVEEAIFQRLSRGRTQ